MGNGSQRSELGNNKTRDCVAQLETHREQEFIDTVLYVCGLIFPSSTRYPGIVTEKINAGVFPELGFCQETAAKDGS